jgi:DNA repair ATPase RecN
MRMLNHDERVGEIASMLSGSNVTQAARDNAEELLANV